MDVRNSTFPLLSVHGRHVNPVLRAMTAMRKRAPGGRPFTEQSFLGEWRHLRPRGECHGDLGPAVGTRAGEGTTTGGWPVHGGQRSDLFEREDICRTPATFDLIESLRTLFCSGENSGAAFQRSKALPAVWSTGSFLSSKLRGLPLCPCGPNRSTSTGATTRSDPESGQRGRNSRSSEKQKPGQSGLSQFICMVFFICKLDRFFLHAPLTK